MEEQMRQFRQEEDLLLSKGYQEALLVDVNLTGYSWTEESGLRHLSLPFVGRAVGEHFQGEIQPGASDEQYFEGERPLHFTATYSIQGQTGTVHVVNRSKDGGPWQPTVTAEGETLAAFDLSDCKAILFHRPQGPMVHIYARKK